MKIALIQHTEDSPPGSTLNWFKEKNLDYAHYKLYENSKLPSLESFDTLFICGGAMNVDDQELFEWMKFEKKLIGDSIKAKKRLIGLCLGGQLIAEALGARVGRHPHWEVGWQDVHLNSIRSADIPVHENPFKVFQWHRYSFDIPQGAERFATNSICENQGFCYQGVALAMQFHPETDVAWVQDCAADPSLPSSSKSLAGTKSVQTPAEILAGISNQANLQKWYFTLLNSFLK